MVFTEVFTELTGLASPGKDGGGGSVVNELGEGCERLGEDERGDGRVSVLAMLLVVRWANNVDKTSALAACLSTSYNCHASGSREEVTNARPRWQNRVDGPRGS